MDGNRTVFLRVLCKFNVFQRFTNVNFLIQIMF